MRTLSIKFRILLLAAVPTFLLAVLLTWLAISNANDIVEDSLKQQRQSLTEEKRKELDELLEMAISATQSATDTEQVKAILRKLRYDHGNNYFFVYDTRGVQVVSADNPEREGKNFYDSRSPDGRNLVREYIEAARKGGDYIEYNWPKAGQSQPSPKLAKAIKFPGQDWVIATGFYIDDLDRTLAELEAKLRAQSRNSMISILILAALLLAAALVLGALLARSIIQPLNGAVAAMQNIASGEGDLTRRLDESLGHELGALAKAFNTFAGKVAALVNNVRGSVKTLALSSEELSQIMQQADEGVRRQHSESDMVAVAMNEMSAAAQEVASSASNAAGATGEVEKQVKGASVRLDDAIKVIGGLEVKVNTGVDVISKVGEESKSIGSVLEVISGIAEQTNLLALNAAIEAARAGEQGRGFAVVADEVRTLAARTAASTGEINQMIGRLQSGANEAVGAISSIREGSEETVKQTKEVDRALKEIYQAVTTINDMNNQIAAAAEQQTTVSESINENLHTIVSIAEQSARGTQEANNISTSLNKLAADLQELVGSYKT
ncbi:methyl-accepting chemotaxis protein [Bowmanella denitrificans]|uniref:Methyl-accepting chemotaxis protein n=1 Tax=Bowmanella denitrificans TaxID=366582 RepID=A0ABN0XQY5_9ALTE